VTRLPRLGAVKARLRIGAGLSPPSGRRSRTRARVRRSLHRPSSVARATTAAGPMSVWNVGGEGRIVRGDDPNGPLLSFVTAPASTAEMEREPAGRALRPPAGLSSEPKVLVVGLARNVATVLLADRMLAPAELVVAEPDADVVMLAGRLAEPWGGIPGEVRSGQPFSELLRAIADGTAFDLVIVEDSTLIGLVMSALSASGTLVVRTSSAADADASSVRLAEDFAAVRRVRIDQRSTETLVFAEIRRTATSSGAASSTSVRGSTNSGLTVDVVHGIHELRKLSQAWLDVVVRAPASSAYQSPAWVLPWFEYFAGTAEATTLVVRRRSDVVGIVPFARWSVGGGGRGLEYLWSAGTEHGDYGEPAIADGSPEIAAAVVEHLAERTRRGVSIVDLRRLMDEGPLLRALIGHEGLRIVPIQTNTDSAVVDFELLDDPTAYLAKHARKNRLPQKLVKLEAEVGPVRFVPADDAVDEILEFMRDQWTLRFGDGGPRILAPGRRSAFTHATTRQLIDLGLARLSTLRAGDRLLAVEIVHTSAGIQAWDFGAYDSSLAPYSLGQMVLFEILRQAHLDGASAVDLRYGDFPYKYAWANAGRMTRSLCVLPNGRRGDVGWLARQALVSRRVREVRRLDETAP
jgi:CelD/BcsL family acetyltransferase involved in cellulose biosynthesis